MKQVLILAGSPRLRGNSSHLCDQFQRGAEEAGHAVTRLNVARRRIGGCLGCNACKRDGRACVQRDDMAEVRARMLEADVIVLAAPVYFYSIPAQLKAVLDRSYAFQAQLQDKTFYFLISCAAPEERYAETMLAALRGYLSCLPQAREGGYAIAAGASGPQDAAGSEAAQSAYELGRHMERS